MQKGFATLFIVIILGSIALAFALYAATASSWSVRESIDFRKSYQAKALADACAEVALEKMQEDNAFTGSASLGLENGFCEYQVADSGENIRIIFVRGAVDDIVRKAQINTASFNPITISSWQEIP